MTSAASDIKDGLISHLSSPSLYGEGQVSSNYSVLNTTACCAVVLWTGEAGDPAVFGLDFDVLQTFQISHFVKESNPATLRDDTMGIATKSTCSLRQDHTLSDLNGRTVHFVEADTDLDPDEALEIGGINWLEAVTSVVYGVYT